ncbi:MAG: DUF2155 domain-containing protein [Nitrospirae bacterium]|nr:DUF2155 domain-containing protein [Nitrospirota bacterium]
MKRFLKVSSVVIVILLSIAACKKKEEQPIPKAPMRSGPIMEAPAVAPGHETTGTKVTFQIVVPQDVKDTWSAVKLIVEDKKLNKTQEFIVNLGSELRIPDSNLRIKIGNFLPDFRMDGQIITSVSNMPNNPSVGVVIYEDGKQIFPEMGKEWGWLWARKELQAMHPFMHPKYGITLKEGVSKK